MRSPAPLVVLGLVGCQCGGSASRPAAVAASEGRALPLSELPFAELEVPPDSRPGHRAPEADIPIQGPWRYTGTSKAGMHKYAAPIPIRPRGLFFQKAQPGMSLTDAAGQVVRYDRFGKSNDRMWVHDRTEVVVYFPDKRGAPAPGEYVMHYAPARDREAALNLRFADEEQQDFVWTTITDDWDARRGLLLPAPGVAAWDLEVPPAAELRFSAGLVEPEIRDGDASDGATLTIEVDAGAGPQVVHTEALAIRSFHPVDVDLSRWAGQKVRLRARTEPGASADFDYAFLAEPVVASRVADPKRILMVFVDALRPDHLSLYGYERDTSAALDGLGQTAAVFTNAHTVAPWTLPSSRAIVTGRQPEEYEVATTVQELLRREGFATGFFAGNVYLSQNFSMHRDWEFHRVGLWPRAEQTTDEALAWLDEHEGRDVLLHVHFMSNHLPYVEPEPYRSRYAGERPDGLRDGFLLQDVRRMGNEPELRQYVVDRYDNNVRYVTDQIARLVERLDDDDVLVLFADHGEEFWDHKGFEHGHTLYEELLRVPFVVKAPGIRTGKLDTPVSLLDLAPTLLELAGEPVPAEMDGRSLVPLLRGDDAADAALRGRPQAVGRPLYGQEQWGVLLAAQKWTTTEGHERLFDLASDPDEKTNLVKDDAAAGAPFRARLGEALGRQVAAGYRLVPTSHRGERPVPGLWTLCTVPGGFGAAWAGEDPMSDSAATVHVVDDPAAVRAALDRYGFGDVTPAAGTGAVEVCWHAGLGGSREVYVAPARPIEEVGRELVCAAYYGGASGGKREVLTVAPSADATFAGPRTPLARAVLGGRQLSITLAVAPVVGADHAAIRGRDGETNELLEAMGYVDEEGAPTDHAPEDSAPCEPPR